jgi:hypothetical protein
MSAPRVVVSAVLGAAIGVGCAPLAGPIDAEVVVFDPDADEGYALATRTLTSPLDLAAGRGSVVDVVAGTEDLLATVASNIGAPEPDTFAAFVQHNRTDAGPIAAALSVDGDRVVADDWESLLYLSAVHGFEQVFAFAADVGVDEGPRGHTRVRYHHRIHVGVVERIGTDNAAYNPRTDEWLLYPTMLQLWGPLSGNANVLAHEFGHRVFQYAVFAGPAFAVWRDLDVAPTTRDERRRTQVLDGVNEGFADLFAIAFANDVDAVRVLDNRAMSSPFAQDVTLESIEDDGHPDVCSGVPGDESFNFYCIGTVFAAAVVAGVDGEAARVRDELLPELMHHALPAVGERLADGTPFALPLLLNEVARARPDGAPRAAMCAAFADRFSSVMNEVTSCLP